MPKKTLSDLGNLDGKRVLIRVDFNVPLDKKSGSIANDRRIRAALSTIQALFERNAAIVAMSHLGRPTGDPEKDKSLRMDRVAERFAELLGRPVAKAADQVVGPNVNSAVSALKQGEVLLLENLRFDDREQKNDAGFAAALADLGDAYVNDAFGTCHNDRDASMVAVPAKMKSQAKPRAVGLLVEKELRVIDDLMGSPQRPLIGVMGGAKVADKLAFIRALLSKVDQLLIGGKMTFAFQKALEIPIGSINVSDEEIAAVRTLLPQVGNTIILPSDAVCAKPDDLTQTRESGAAIPDGMIGVDIGPKTLTDYSARIAKAGTVIWNGPVGWFEQPAFSAGTRGIAAAMAASRAVTIVGGGETAEAVEQFGFDEKMTHVSTGGGAFLAYIEGRPFASLAQIDDS
jgi:phosphoglycerate kinase